MEDSECIHSDEVGMHIKSHFLRLFLKVPVTHRVTRPMKTSPCYYSREGIRMGTLCLRSMLRIRYLRSKIYFPQKHTMHAVKSTNPEYIAWWVFTWEHQRNLHHSKRDISSIPEVLACPFFIDTPLHFDACQPFISSACYWGSYKMGSYGNYSCVWLLSLILMPYTLEFQGS